MLFASLHSSERKFATAQYVNRERFLFPYLHSLFVIRSFFVRHLSVLCPFFVRHLFVICSFIVRLLFVFCSSFVRSLFVFCSSFVRLLFVFCSSFVRLLFIISLSARVARTVFLLPAHRAMIACRATTAHTTRTVVLTAHLLII